MPPSHVLDALLTLGSYLILFLGALLVVSVAIHGGFGGRR